MHNVNRTSRPCGGAPSRIVPLSSGSAVRPVVDRLRPPPRPRRGHQSAGVGDHRAGLGRWPRAVHLLARAGLPARRTLHAGQRDLGQRPRLPAVPDCMGRPVLRADLPARLPDDAPARQRRARRTERVGVPAGVPLRDPVRHGVDRHDVRGGGSADRARRGARRRVPAAPPGARPRRRGGGAVGGLLLHVRTAVVPAAGRLRGEHVPGVDVRRTAGARAPAVRAADGARRRSGVHAPGGTRDPVDARRDRPGAPGPTSPQRRARARRLPAARTGPGRGRRRGDGRGRAGVAGHRRARDRSTRRLPGDGDVVVGELHRSRAVRAAVAVVPDDRQVARRGRGAHRRSGCSSPTRCG